MGDCLPPSKSCQLSWEKGMGVMNEDGKIKFEER